MIDMLPLTAPAQRRPDARAALRAATREAHERLHHATEFAAIAERRLDREGYVALLGAIHRFHSLIAPAVARAATLLASQGVTPDGRLALLTDDLRTLGHPPLPSATTLAWRVVAGPGWEVGCLYVAQGSMLGARVIHRQLDYLFGDRDEGRCFFKGTPDDGQRWRTLCAALDGYGSRPERLAAMITGADAVFDLFRQCLEGRRRAT